MNLTQRRKAAFELLMQPIRFHDDWTIEQQIEEIKARRGQVNLVYYFMTISERHVADEWLKSQPRVSDPEFNPVQEDGPTLEPINNGHNQEPTHHGFEPRKRTFRRQRD